jgi:type I restriction enzyme S subunit
MQMDHLHPVLRQLPEDWRLVRIDDLFTIQQGKQVSRKNRNSAPQRPFLRTKNVYWGRLDLNELDAMCFSEEEEQRLRLLPGDLLTCEGGWVGRTAVWNGKVADCLYQNHLHRLRRISTDTDPQFALYWFWYAFEIGDVYFGRQNDTTIPNLSKSRLGELPMPSPSVGEQQKIATVLSAVQRAIKRQERLTTLNAEFKKALMHKLFTEGTRGVLPRQETRFGPVPALWSVVPLGECCQVQTGIAKGRKIDASDAMNVPYLRVANVQDGHLDLQEVKTITIRKDDLFRYLLRPGDVVLTEGGDLDKLGRGFIWNGQIEDCVHQNHIFVVRPNRALLSSDFIAYQAQSSYGKKYFLSVAHKTTNLACINASKLKAFPVLIPTKEEQAEITAILQSIDQRQSVAAKTLIALESLFRTLLSQLMSAQIRIHDLDLSAIEKSTQPTGAA